MQRVGLQQRIYSSAATATFTEVELSRLLLTARRNNQRVGVTGMLLYDKGSFLQVLEGEEAAVQALFERIERDPRHGRVRTLMCQATAARAFGDWAMGFVSIGALGVSLPGYSDFLQHRGDPGQAGGLAHSLMTQFREGRLRSYVGR